MNDSEKATVKRAKDVLQFMLLTGNGDLDEDYAALMTLLGMFFLEANQVDESNIDMIQQFIQRVDYFIEGEHRAMVALSN